MSLSFDQPIVVDQIMARVDMLRNRVVETWGVRKLKRQRV